MEDTEKYDCPLSQFALKVAKEELREDEETRIFALQQMREWIKKNPRIIFCRTGKLKIDSSFFFFKISAKSS